MKIQLEVSYVHAEADLKLLEGAVLTSTNVKKVKPVQKMQSVRILSEALPASAYRGTAVINAWTLMSA